MTTMNDDTEILAGILAATEEQYMPQVVAEHDVDGQRVAIVEPVWVRDGELLRGYLWHAVVGEFVLTPTRPGDVDPDRWGPGGAVGVPGGGFALVATSTVSAAAAAANARRKLRRGRR